VKVDTSLFCRVKVQTSPVFLLSCEVTHFSCVLSCEGTDSSRVFVFL
jgi:hypothetical protein